jgi:drug/metabolite transporter (DMT)-like permease
MTNFLLYAATVLFWGTSWIAVQFQLGSVAPEASVAYRFILSAMVLTAFCLIVRKPMRFGAKVHGLFAVQGMLLFSTNFYLIYVGSQYLPSGLVSVAFSTLSVFNIINAALFFKTPIRPRVMIGALTGFSGLCLVFAPELTGFSLADESLVGLLWCLGGTLSASLGMMLSMRNKMAGIPMVQTNAWGMVYGAAFMCLIALILGVEFTIDLSPGYMLSLGYLAVFATVIAFATYLTLQVRIGPDKSAYITVLFPILAIAISTVVEGYALTALSAVGFVLVLWGNFLVMTKMGTSRGALNKLLGKAA